MSKLNDEVYVAGGGCTCAAYSESECCCDVDWTNPKIYELEDKLENYKELLDLITGVYKLSLTPTAKYFMIQDITEEYAKRYL